MKQPVDQMQQVVPPRSDDADDERPECYEVAKYQTMSSYRQICIFHKEEVQPPWGCLCVICSTVGCTHGYSDYALSELHKVVECYEVAKRTWKE